jgi:hypothetical protein
MLTIISEKTSLRDLSISELRRVSWNNIDPSEFTEDLNDTNFLARLSYANKVKLVEMVDWGDFVVEMNEDALMMLISAHKQLYSRTRFQLSSRMFETDKQFSLEFLTTNARYLYLHGSFSQDCVTPEFVEEQSDYINYGHFFEHFLRRNDIDKLRPFITYKNGMFLRWISSSRSVRYMNREMLNHLNFPVPSYQDTIITEQRIMSGQPCDDGQRSFTIWLRKFRRVTGRVNDYPTWDEMLSLMKSHPRLNNNGYVDWIYSNCLTNSDQVINQYPTSLSYQPTRVRIDAYRHITGVDNEQANEDYNVEFYDVVNPNSTVEIEVNDSTDETEVTDSTESDSTDEFGSEAPDIDLAMTEMVVSARSVQPMTEFVMDFSNILRTPPADSENPANSTD